MKVIKPGLGTLKDRQQYEVFEKLTIKFKHPPSQKEQFLRSNGCLASKTPDFENVFQ